MNRNSIIRKAEQENATVPNLLHSLLERTGEWLMEHETVWEDFKTANPDIAKLLEEV